MSDGRNFFQLKKGANFSRGSASVNSVESKTGMNKTKNMVKNNNLEIICYVNFFSRNDISP